VRPISKDGKRIFEIEDSTAYRVYDFETRTFLSNEPISADVAAISGDGQVVLDADLHSLAPDGSAGVDFRPFLPDDVRVPGYPHSCVHALSFDGGAVAIGALDATNAPQTVVLYADGRVVRLPDSPGYEGCEDGASGLDWSTDGQHLLQFSGGGLRVWDLTTASLTARTDGVVRRAAFLVAADRIVTVDESGTVAERDLSLATLFTSTTTIDGRSAAFDPRGEILGSDASGLGILYRGDDVGRWPRYGSSDWQGAVAVREADSFSLASDAAGTTVPYAVRLERFEQGKAGPVAVFRSNTGQSEWRGDVALSPDESRLAAVFPDVIAVLDSATLAPLARIAATAGTIAWSPDGRYLAATPDVHYRDVDRAPYHPAAEIAVWDAATGKLARRFAAPAYASQVAFDKEGAKLVGWGYPQLEILPGTPNGMPAPWPITSVTPTGDPISFQIDVLTGTVSTTTLPRFVGATRELIATPSNVVAISTGAPISAIPSPAIRGGVFSGDFSLLLAVEDGETSGSTDTHLVSVADGRMIATIPTFWGSYRPALALSRNGRRVQLDDTIYCLVDRP
jgi:WD40 repeat protein